MSYTQKIYYNNKPIILTDSKKSDKSFENYAIFEGANTLNFNQAIKWLDQKDSQGAIVIETNKERLEKEILWSFYPLHSGGGVVVNENGNVLMIFRRGKWDLPKGKLDDGELIEQCAVREVIEETGLKTVNIEHKICNTLHIYPMGDQLILKHTAWYLMKGSLKEKLSPQKEEDIEKVMWVKPSEISPLLQNSFETIGDVLIEAKIL